MLSSSDTVLKLLMEGNNWDRKLEDDYPLFPSLPPASNVDCFVMQMLLVIKHKGKDCKDCQRLLTVPIRVFPPLPGYE